MLNINQSWMNLCIHCAKNFISCQLAVIFIDMQSKFYEARFIRTMFLVEISLGKEPDLAGFEGKL